MTADALFDRTLPLLFATAAEKAELQNDFLQLLGIISAECLELENGLRRREGQPELSEPPQYAAIGDEVPYHWRVTAVMPYGVAGYLGAEDDPTNAAIYKNKYEAERAALTTGEFESVVDVYGESAL